MVSQQFDQQARSSTQGCWDAVELFASDKSLILLVRLLSVNSSTISYSNCVHQLCGSGCTTESLVYGSLTPQCLLLLLAFDPNCCFFGVQGVCATKFKQEQTRGMTAMQQALLSPRALQQVLLNMHRYVLVKQRGQLVKPGQHFHDAADIIHERLLLQCLMSD